MGADASTPKTSSTEPGEDIFAPVPTQRRLSRRESKSRQMQTGLNPERERRETTWLGDVFDMNALDIFTLEKESKGDNCEASKDGNTPTGQGGGVETEEVHWSDLWSWILPVDEEAETKKREAAQQASGQQRLCPCTIQAICCTLSITHTLTYPPNRSRGRRG
jgi:hypothetical protein